MVFVFSKANPCPTINGGGEDEEEEDNGDEEGSVGQLY